MVRAPGSASAATVSSTRTTLAVRLSTRALTPGPKDSASVAASPVPTTVTTAAVPARSDRGNTASTCGAASCLMAFQSPPTSECSGSNQRPVICAPSLDAANTSLVSVPPSWARPRHSKPVYTMACDSPGTAAPPASFSA